jgi:hypothetical protein
MFDEIIRASFSNSSNLRGDALDGNWVFLLPNLQLKRVLCVGQPSPQTMATLTALTNDVVQAESVEGVGSGFDLIYVESVKSAPDLPDLARLLAPCGNIYYEDRGSAKLNVPDGLRLLQALWLTPTFGNMQTAVPLADRPTIAYFSAAGLYSPSVTQHTFDDLQRRWRKRSASASKSLIVSAGGSSKSGRKGWKRSFRTGLRKFRNAATTVAPVLENVITRNRLLKPLFDRRGVLLTSDAQATAHRLPEYLRHIALDGNVDLSAFRWGYAARGRYRSQKLLYFLFQPMAEKPVYIIKMVRDTVFNPRLEREHKGLLLLQERRLMPAGTLPEIVFFGHHRDLAIVSETVVEGEPFDTRSRFDASCRYAHTAVGWLIDLSAHTVVSQPPVDLAGSLQQLVDRFCEIYKPSSEHQAYLNHLVARLRETLLPAVFQHGDPGTWNLLVTTDDKVAFLDWENATEYGVPIWDLLYFLRSYCVAAGQKTGNYGVLAAFEHYFIESSPLSPFIIDAFEGYCQRVALDATLVEPLFLMCWVFWAVKQAALVEAVGLQTAHYVQLVKLCIDRRDSPTLARIFSLEKD